MFISEDIARIAQALIVSAAASALLSSTSRRCVTRDTIDAMHTRKAQVKNGRLILDEPTDLPDGAEVNVLLIDDELTAEERAQLHASLDRALDDSEADRGMDVWEFLERYRARRESRPAR